MATSKYIPQEIGVIQPARVLKGATANPNTPDAKPGDLIPYAFNARVDEVMWFCIGFKDEKDVEASLLAGKYTMLTSRPGGYQGSKGGMTVKKETGVASAKTIEIQMRQLQLDSETAKENAAPSVRDVAESLAASGAMAPEALAELFKSARQRRLEAQQNEAHAENIRATTGVKEEPLILATP